LHGSGSLFSPNITPWAAAFYMGASMSITAFPMLARILHEKGLIKTKLWTLVLAAGSIDDAIAWCLLALVLASIKSSINIAVIAIGGTLIYVLFMWFVGRRAFLDWILKTEKENEQISPSFYGITGI
jgi:Kef-type K+ transport system membrane component KefB